MAGLGTDKSNSEGPAKRVAGMIGRLFPERQLLVRTGSTVRFAPLSTGRQMLMAAGAVAVIGWTSFATLAWVDGQRAIAGKQAELEQAMADAQSVRDGYQQAFGRIEEYQALFAGVTCEVETIQGNLMQLADRAQGKKRGVVDACAQGADARRSLVASSQGPTTAIVGTMSERESLKGRVARLQSSVERLKDSHADFLRRTSSLAEARIDELETTLHKVGLSPDTLMHRSDFGQGGPYLPARFAVPSETPSLADLVSLNGTIDRLDMLTQAMRSLPLTAPLADYEITSPYGTRNDPLNEMTGMHEGIDLGAPSGTPVNATADGRVVSAGWRDRYGLMVEIDHGMGLTTRYAHLSRILVRDGQAVDRNSVVGLLGSTGRSTGPHLHYEVRLQGQPRNPSMFFRAGQNVFALQ